MMTPFQYAPGGAKGLLWVAATTAFLAVGARPALAQNSADESAVVERKGFVINLGLGLARVSTSVGDFSDSGTGIATDFKIGYAPNDQLLLYYSNDAAFQGQDNSDDIRVDGVSGIGATYFLAPGSNSFYVDAAVGVAASGVISSEGTTSSDSGTGVTVGGGFEFAKHWLLDGDVILGRYDGVNTTTFRIGLMWFYY